MERILITALAATILAISGCGPIRDFRERDLIGRDPNSKPHAFRSIGYYKRNFWTGEWDLKHFSEDQQRKTSPEKVAIPSGSPAREAP